MELDYYVVLDITKDASEVEVKKAWVQSSSVVFMISKKLEKLLLSLQNIWIFFVISDNFFLVYISCNNIQKKCLPLNIF